MDRIARLLSMSARSSRIIEIGAGYCPAAPKAAGWDSHVVDHATQDELRAKYAAAAVDLNAIEPVDTVWQQGTLHDAIPRPLHGRFDTMIASHVLEHMPDFVGFLESADRLLAPGGTVALALPDRRFCFDFFKPPTMTGDVLEARTERRTRHSLRTAWNHMAYSVTASGRLAWGPGPVGAIALMDPFEAARDTWSNHRNDPLAPYVDYHVWHFTPAGFSLVMLELGLLGLVNWRIDRLEGPENFEFFAFLRRGTGQFPNVEAAQAERLRLLRQQLRETREQVSAALEASEGAPPPAVEGGQYSGDHLAEILAVLRQQDQRLRNIETVAGWARTALHPVRAVWRSVRRRSADSG